MTTLFHYLLVISALLFSGFACRPTTEPSQSFNMDPVIELMHYDRHAVKRHRPSPEDILRPEHHHVVEIPDLGVKAHVFFWGGEVGGPWSRILSFYREKPQLLQRQFLYEGEYPMTRMGNREKPPFESGENHYLGHQLTAIGLELGPEIYLNPEKMKILLRCTMTDLLGCSLMNEKTNTDPNVLYFNGELTHGVWKGTVRQYDHTGRFCVQLDYLNGERAYTLWL